MTLLKELIPLTFLQSPDIEAIKAISVEVPFNFQTYNLESSNLLSIQKEFTKFFRVAGKDYLPPYESCWVLKKFPDEPFCVPRLYSKTTEEIHEIYDALKISPLSNFSEPPDHISFELAVYFSIKDREITDIDKPVKTFIEEHFNKWVPEYLKQLSEKEGIFYPDVARYLLEVLNKSLCFSTS